MQAIDGSPVADGIRWLQRACRVVPCAWLLLQAAGGTPIDRHALVARHDIHWNEVAGRVPLGNGEFCFGADGTGLQTFAGNSMAHWGWHSFPLPAGCTREQVPETGAFDHLDTHGVNTAALNRWMFDNPHIMNLGRLRLTRTGGKAVAPDEIAKLTRTLDLWSGVQTSIYQIDGSQVKVETCVHPSLDMVAVRVESFLIGSGGLEVALDFAYPNLENRAWVGDFDRVAGHTSELAANGPQRVDIRRTVDATIYHAGLAAGGTGRVRESSAGGRRTFVVSAAGAADMTLVCAFSPAPLPAVLPTFAETRAACTARWETFWSGGGAIDLSASKDPRWLELERRIVLSQYHMAAQSAGTWPSAETGLLGLDPWRSQFHMEMVWWHLAHYALWDRWEMGDKALRCYREFMPVARELARQLGTRGVKWGKSCGPEGRSAPWSGNHPLLWKQPHPIFFAELEYRLKPTRATLVKWAAIIHGTAEQMADCVKRDPATGCYGLDPVMPPSEQGITKNDVFDLAYWRWGLDKAQEWRERMGLQRVARWDEVRRDLTPLPVEGGVFVHSTEWHDTYDKRAWEHPDPVGVFGMIPPTGGVDRETAHRTVRKVWETWNWDRTWGWDMPWFAMAAARVGEPSLAVEALLKPSARNGFDPIGINTGGPCPYLPGNGGLLYAVAMMAAGWDGCPDKPAPGFPDDGNWSVKWEGLKRAP